jgi:hypothetical protein
MAAEDFQAKAIVLHDAEDVVHPDELTVFEDGAAGARQRHARPDPGADDQLLDVALRKLVGIVTSLTEDYELGLRIAELGGQGLFARVADGTRGGVVAGPSRCGPIRSGRCRSSTAPFAGRPRAGWRGNRRGPPPRHRASVRCDQPDRGLRAGPAHRRTGWSGAVRTRGGWDARWRSRHQ